MKNHRNEIYKIEVYEIDDAMEREIYETYAINSLRAKYNVDKVFSNKKADWELLLPPSISFFI